MSKELPIKISIGRPHGFDGAENIRIEVDCSTSRSRFLEIEIGAADFAKALTGLSLVECNGIVRNLDRVGRFKEFKVVEFEVSKTYGCKDEAAEKVKDYLVDGYITHTGFSSQNSFFTRDGKSYARTSIARWVDDKPREAPCATK